MPSISPLVLVLLFIGFRYVIRRLKVFKAIQQQAGRQPERPIKPQSPPTPFQEAAPVSHAVPAREDKPATASKSLEQRRADAQRRDLYTPRLELADEGDPIQEMLLNEDQPLEGGEERARPLAGFTLAVSAQSLVQAVIMKEVLSPPPSARRGRSQRRLPAR